MGRCTESLITIGVVLALLAVAIILVFSLAFGYLRHVKITVDDASLTHMALVTTPTSAALAYNLSLKLVVRNPNWAIAIKHVKPLEAAYSFDDQQFDRVQVAGKGDRQRAMRTVVYRIDTSSGGRSVSLGNAGEASFREQNKTGLFEVEVKLTGKFSYTARYTKCKIEATCPLKLQLAPPGTPAVVFEKVKCELAKPEKYC